MNSSTICILIKLPCLFLVTVCSHISYKAPNPRQGVKDGAVIKTYSEVLLRCSSATIWFLTICFWLVASAEIAVLTASVFPSLPISQPLLDTLLYEGDASQIRLTKFALLAVPLALIGTMIRVQCFQALGKHFTFELCIHADHVLVTTGPYSIVRHPSYVGVIANFLSLCALHGTNGSWIRESGVMNNIFGQILVYTFIGYFIPGIIAMLRRMSEEDRELRARFGKQWDEWAARVPYSLIPGII
ncbi:hypothetical protein M378DRAFT_173751 [Amanita muscaria Koide BX008]|uniref:Protein-S-isoprenylcysteine O-methyltransferase n=1 Tax=Amanita muscaria (strain Koide BX008) TaxID=946122 RepID=A0A0C2WF99_AMAMK|nr:hypothetical protein M378DRAFT_173751 [Amanita muscaria Koide BX008]